jgi:DNA excision repair protein ERCC-1
MQLLPGLGPIKVRRIKDAFEKPFYPRASAVDTTKNAARAEIQSSIGQSQATSSLQNEYPQPADRWPSPIWDIELDLNPSEVDGEGVGRQNKSKSTSSLQTNGVHAQEHPREPSPIWDIELDLNDSDDHVSSQEYDEPSKRRRI